MTYPEGGGASIAGAEETSTDSSPDAKLDLLAEELVVGKKTIETGRTCFWSRSRQKFWIKGETSGHVQTVKDIAFDCDGDTLLIQVEQVGAACHEGYQSCFFRSTEPNGSGFRVTESRLEEPEQIYGKK